MPVGWVCQERTQGVRSMGARRLPSAFWPHTKGTGNFFWKIMGRDCPTVKGQRPGRCQDLSIFRCHRRILWRKTTCRTPLCNATGKVTAFKAKPDSGPARGEVFVCLRARSLRLRIDFWPPMQQVGGRLGGWRRLGAECGLASTAPGSPLLLWDFFFF